MPARFKAKVKPELTWNFGLATAVVVFIFVLGVILRVAKPVLIPLFIGLFLAFILMPVLDFFTRLKVPRVVAIILLVLITFLVLYLLGFLFYSSGRVFADEFPRYGKKFSDLTEHLRQQFHITSLEWDPLAWLTKLDVNKIATFLLSQLGPFLSFLANLVLVFLFLIFVLAGRGSLQAKIRQAYSRERASQLLVIINHISRQIQRFLVIKTAVNLVVGIITTVFLVLLGLDFALVFGFLAFLLNYIPNIGAIVAAVFPAVMAFIQFDNVLVAVLIALFIYLMELAMGFVEVRLMGQGLGLSPLLVFFSLVFWWWLWGVPGMILAVPILAIIKIICYNIPALKPLSLMMSSGARAKVRKG